MQVSLCTRLPPLPAKDDCTQTSHTDHLSSCQQVRACHIGVVSPWVQLPPLPSAPAHWGWPALLQWPGAGCLLVCPHDAAVAVQAQHKKAKEDGSVQPGPITTGREIIAESGVLVRVCAVWGLGHSSGRRVGRCTLGH